MSSAQFFGAKFGKEVALQSTLRLTFRSTSNVPHQRDNDAKHVDKEPRGSLGFEQHKWSRGFRRRICLLKNMLEVKRIPAKLQVS